MGVAKQYLFAPFRLDSTNEQLWCGEETIPLRRKTFEVLRFLVENRAQLVTKTALLDALWPQIIVSDSMPTICVGELRKALSDNAKTPRFIETVHGRGYRFIANVATAEASVKPRSHSCGLERIVVGRDAELALLGGWFAEVLEGERRVVFVAGEPGIGKTTFVRAFLDSIGDQDGVRIGVGQCIEQYGAAEPYMPVLESLTRLRQERGGERLLEILHQLAPMWLAQMPELLSEGERQASLRDAQGVTQHRMLREMAQALEALTADLPLVLFLEDLHWSDFSTLELIATIARRTETARLLIIGTYRPMEMLRMEHPLRTMKGELELHRQCEELRLTLLSEKYIADYLTQRFAEDGPDGARERGLGGAGRNPERTRRGSRPGESATSAPRSGSGAIIHERPFERVASAIHDRTDGNPLFMVNVVDYLVEHGSLVDPGKIEPPRSIVQMIEFNLERLDSDEQAVLEGASVVGAKFSAAAVAAALDRPVSEIEARCTHLSRHEQFVQTHGISEWPDGTVAETFRFHHALYGDVLYGRIAAGHRVELHRRIAEREENAYGDRAGEIAAELAHHWRCANDKNKAIEYLGRAGQQAIQRSAQAEAIGNLTAAIDLLQSLPNSPERIQRELNLQLALAAALFAVKGGAAAEVEGAYDRVRALCQQDNWRELFHALFGLWVVHYQRGELLLAYRLGEELLRRAQSANDPALLLYARIALGDSSTLLGKLHDAREHFETGIALYNGEPHRLLGGVDPGVNCLSYLAFVLLALGYPEQALARSKQALASARASSNPYTLAYAESLAGRFHQARRDPRATLEVADHLYAVSAELGYSYWLAQATCERGGAMAALGRDSEGIAQIEQGLAAFRPTGAKYMRPPYLCLLAEACCSAGRVDEGLNALNEAFAAVNEHGSPEMYQLKGQLLLRQDASNAGEAENCFRRVIEIASNLSSKYGELRATISLARLLATQGRRDEARTTLAEIYGWFTEGFDTFALTEAKVLLEELSRERTPPANSNGNLPRRSGRHARIQ